MKQMWSDLLMNSTEQMKLEMVYSWMVQNLYQYYGCTVMRVQYKLYTKCIPTYLFLLYHWGTHVRGCTARIQNACQEEKYECASGVWAILLGKLEEGLLYQKPRLDEYVMKHNFSAVARYVKISEHQMNVTALLLVQTSNFLIKQIVTGQILM